MFSLKCKLKIYIDPFDSWKVYSVLLLKHFAIVGENPISLKMTFSKKSPLWHVYTTTIVHTLQVNQEILEQTREARSNVKYNKGKKSTETVFDFWRKINGKKMVHSKETRLDTKIQKVTKEDILSKDDKKIFQKDWADKWAPRIKDSELFTISGLPADEMNQEMDENGSFIRSTKDSNLISDKRFALRKRGRIKQIQIIQLRREKVMDDYLADANKKEMDENDSLIEATQGSNPISDKRFVHRKKERINQSQTTRLRRERAIEDHSFSVTIVENVAFWFFMAMCLKQLSQVSQKKKDYSTITFESIRYWILRASSASVYLCLMTLGLTAFALVLVLAKTFSFCQAAFKMTKSLSFRQMIWA